MSQTLGPHYAHSQSQYSSRENTVGRSQQALAASKKDKKDAPLFDKISTLGRKKKKEEEEEAQLVVREGKDAIETPGWRIFLFRRKRVKVGLT